MPKLTVSIGIPAFNEEANIASLLKVLLNQKQDNFILREILVVSDGSTDQTVARAKSIDSPLIKVIENHERIGQQQRQNEILKMFSSDLLFLIEADTLPINNQVIDQLVQRVLDYQGRDLGMVLGNSIDQFPETFYERILYYANEFKGDLFRQWKGGDSVYNSGGHSGKLITRLFAKDLMWPSDVPEDSYIYLRLKQLKLKIIKEYSAKIYSRNVSTVADRYRQSTKFKTGKESLEKYFGPEVVSEAFFVSKPFVVKMALKQLILNPIWMPLILLDMVINRLATLRLRTYNELYEPYYSSKKIHNYTALNSVKDLSQVTVSVGIAAFNAEDNIKAIIAAILKQQTNNFTFEKLIVHSDRSADGTVREAQSIEDERLMIIDSSERNGFAQSFRKILQASPSSITVLLNDDISITDDNFLETLVETYAHDSDIGLIAGNAQPLPPRTFVEKAVISTFRVYEKMRETFKGGNNQFTCDGKVLVLSKKFADAFLALDTTEFVGNVDSFLYFFCLDRGFKYVFAKNAVAYYRTPSTVSDYLSWSIRNNKDFYSMKDRFSNLPESEFTTPGLVVYAWQEFLKNPLGVIFIFFIRIYISVRARLLPKFDKAWEVVSSSKELN